MLAITENCAPNRIKRVLLTDMLRNKLKRRAKKYTPAFLQSVPIKMAQGITLHELATSVGGTAGSLYQICRKYDIKLPPRPPKNYQDGRQRTLIRLKLSTVQTAKRRASAIGLTTAELLAKLLDIIADDDMFNAVLDDGE